MNSARIIIFRRALAYVWLAILLATSQMGRAQTTATWIGPASGRGMEHGGFLEQRPRAGRGDECHYRRGHQRELQLADVGGSFGVLTNLGVLNVNATGFKNTGITMLNPGGTGKLLVNSGGVVR